MLVLIGVILISSGVLLGLAASIQIGADNRAGTGSQRAQKRLRELGFGDNQDKQ